jgi:hypothetical protein
VTTPKRLAVLRIRQDTGDGVPHGTTSDRAVREYVALNTVDHTAVLEYWEQQTDRYLGLGAAEIFPWVDVVIPPGTPTGPGPGPERTAVLDIALAATRAVTPVDGFDGCVVVADPATRPWTDPSDGMTKRIDLNTGTGGSSTGEPGCIVGFG